MKVTRLSDPIGLMTHCDDNADLPKIISHIVREAITDGITPNCITFDFHLDGKDATAQWVLILWGDK